MDYTIVENVSSKDSDWLTAKSEFEYTQGGKGDTRIRIMSGRPLAIYVIP